MTELPFDNRAGANDLLGHFRQGIHPDHNDILYGGGDRHGLEVLGEFIGAVLSINNPEVFERFDKFLDEERNPFRSGQDQFLYLPVQLL